MGKKLVKEWMTYARELGCHKVEVASRSAAKNFYKKCGLALEGKRNLSYFGIDQYLFGKIINRPNDQIMIED